ncbi:hypothetical protein QYF61_004814 [Mycteria americana]|uniref:Uncharacterized protein n=1 Tax=Mycteria americana TaxID=33587 RepID=A0AAN7RQ43_MYCAM|nr:hypothetical protein QYF61_004814 [Mycteria americana]
MLAGLDPLVILYMPCDSTQDDLLHQLPRHQVRGPKLSTVFEVRPHQCRVQGHNHFPTPAGHAVSDTSQDAIGFLGHLGTLLAHIQLAVNQHSQVLFCQAAFQPLFPKPVVLHGVVVAQVQDLALSVVESHTTGLGPSIQPVQANCLADSHLEILDIAFLNPVSSYKDLRYRLISMQVSSLCLQQCASSVEVDEGTAAPPTTATGTAAEPGNQPCRYQSPLHKKQSWKKKSAHLERDDERAGPSQGEEKEEEELINEMETT